MCRMRRLMVVLVMLLSSVGSALAADLTWPKELTFALLSTESAPEVGRRWTPVLEQLSKDLSLPVKQVAATDYRGSIEALKFNKAQIGQLGPKGYVEASNKITPMWNPSHNCSTPTAPWDIAHA
jgi:phosphonate transport system permease protein